jgi:hypothetical protein
MFYVTSRAFPNNFVSTFVIPIAALLHFNERQKSTKGAIKLQKISMVFFSCTFCLQFHELADERSGKLDGDVSLVLFMENYD